MISYSESIFSIFKKQTFTFTMNWSKVLLEFFPPVFKKIFKVLHTIPYSDFKHGKTLV